MVRPFYLTSSVEIGQGAQTSLAQIVGDELGLPFERVTVTLPDTDLTPYDKSTSSSRTTFHMGQAAQKAAREIRNQLLDVAAKALEARVEDLELKDGTVRQRRAGKKAIDHRDLQSPTSASPSAACLAATALRPRAALIPRPARAKARRSGFSPLAGAEVEVDTETGKVRVLRAVTAVDVGKAIHPLQCDLQNEGSCSRAWVRRSSKRWSTTTASRSTAISWIICCRPWKISPWNFTSFLVETPHPDGPFGAKGMGEAGLPPMAPAIGNAIANALGGVRIRDLPIKPDKIVAALRRQRRKT